MRTAQELKKRRGAGIWMVIWVVMMMFWLFGVGGYTYSRSQPDFAFFGAYTLIPWCCVLLLGLMFFGAISKE